MPSRAEVLRSGTIGGEEALGVPRGFDLRHAAFPLARRLVGVFRAVVQVAVLPVFDARQDLPLGRVLVPPALHQDIEHSPVLIHGPPEIRALPIEREEDFIHMQQFPLRSCEPDVPMPEGSSLSVSTIRFRLVKRLPRSELTGCLVESGLSW